MLHLRRHAPSETNMSYWRLTYSIGVRHAPSKADMPVETHRTPTCLLVQSEFKHIYVYIYLNILIVTYLLLIYIYWNNVRTLNSHIGLWWVFDQECRSPMCLKLAMHVSWSLIRHVCLRPSMSVSNGLSIRYVGLRLVSDRSPIDARK